MAQAHSTESSEARQVVSSKRSPATAEGIQTNGVDSLIDRLRDEGIAQGRSQAQELVKTAEKRASDILAAAQREAESILAKAKDESGRLRASAESAIALAMRDTLLSLENDVVNEFQNELVNLIKGRLIDTVFLQSLILEVASKAAPATKDRHVELLLSNDIVSLDDLQRKPEQAAPGTLMHFVLTMGGGMLREGLTFGVADDGQAGIRVRLVDDDVRIDLTQSAISDLLLSHLLPRFRALLRGKVVMDRGDSKQLNVAKVAKVVPA
jgi:V/A-type H+/Na+-transporting ATPase subunit E